MMFTPLVYPTYTVMIPWFAVMQSKYRAKCCVLYCHLFSHLIPYISYVRLVQKIMYCAPEMYCFITIGWIGVVPTRIWIHRFLRETVKAS